MKIFFTILLLFTIVVSCTKNEIEVAPIPPCDGTEVSYKNHIEPLIKASCATGLGPGTGCHDAWILTYDGLKTSVDDGSFLRTTILDKSMPKVPNSFGIEKLTKEEMNLIICWLENDAPNN